MKLLIVDDQPGVLQGLLNGINWEAEGFKEVSTAQNTLEARRVFEEGAPDVMLCDIEMPVENGLQLFEWVQQKEYDTHCIFLTSHAEFDYAQKAVHLGALDYIVQPAPYEEVVKAVRKAVRNVESQREKQLVYDMGQAFNQQKLSIAANVQRDFLMGIHNSSYMETLEKLGSLPAIGRPCYLVLVQIVRWYSMEDRLDAPSLAEELANLCNDVFITNSCRVVVSHMENNTFGLILQDREDAAVSEEEIERQLLYINSMCEQCLKCSLACYLSGPLLMEEIPGRWPSLVERRSANVVMQSGVFTCTPQMEPAPPRQYHMARIQHWGSLLKDGYAQTMEEEAYNLLDELVKEGTMSARTLQHFYQDFLYMLYGTIDDAKELIYTLFTGPEELEIYRNGMKSVEQMKALVHHVAANYQVKPQEIDQKDMVFQVISYINEHLDSELRRDELAGHVHLNPDYMTRIFKKEIGITIKEYITQRKMREAQSLLKTTALPVSFIAAKLGYCNFSHFSQTYKKTMGNSPLDERSGSDEQNKPFL